MKRQTCARWVLLFGVLAGLFFSGGEGIQLFPFPVTELNHTKISASNLEENSKSYAFSVFSSRNYSTLLKSKFQKDANQYLSGELLTCAGLDLRANLCLSAARNHKEPDLLRRSLDPDSQSDRAPPAV